MFKVLFYKLQNLLKLDLKYFLHGGFWIVTSIIINILGGILLSAFYARVWPTDVYGQFAFLTSAIGFLSLTTFPAMSQMVIQGVAEGKEGIYIQAVKISVRWSVIGSFLLFSGSIYFFLRDNSILALATFIGALFFPLLSFNGLYGSYLNGKKQFKKSAIYNSISFISSIIATTIVLLTYPSIPLVIFASIGVPAFVNLIFTYKTWLSIKNHSFDPKLITLGKHLSVSQIATIGADHLDKFLVPLMLGFNNNAIYAFATIIPLQLHSFLKTFTSLSLPKIAEADDRQIKRDLLGKVIQLEVILALLVITTIIFTPLAFDLLYPTYKESASFLSQLFSLSLLYFPTNILSLSFVRKREFKYIYYINIIYLASTTMVLITLIPLYGLLGAVIGKIITRAIYSLTQIYFFKKIY